MILNDKGEPITPPDKHQFGVFRLPDDARLSLREGIQPAEYPYIPNMYGRMERDDAKTRCQG
jgi:hypothetical protein